MRALFFCALQPSPFDPKINGFPGLMVEHCGDLSCSGFHNMLWENRHTNAIENLTP